MARDFHSDDMTVNKLQDALQETYDLGNAIIDRIEFIYATKIGSKGNMKIVSISGGKKYWKVQSETTTIQVFLLIRLPW